MSKDRKSALPVVKPADIAIAFGFTLPRTRKEFAQEVRRLDCFSRPVPSPYICQSIQGGVQGEGEDDILERSFRNYQNAVLSRFLRLEELAEKRGATLVSVTFAEFGQLLERKFSAVILFSHHEPSFGIEFLDGIFSQSMLIKKIPQVPPHVRLLDLSVCNADLLTRDLSAEPRDMLFAAIKGQKRDTSFWMEFYYYFLKLIEEQELTYTEALRMLYEHYYKLSG